MDPDSEGELEDINTQECDGRTADGAKDPTCWWPQQVIKHSGRSLRQKTARRNTTGTRHKWKNGQWCGQRINWQKTKPKLEFTNIHGPQMSRVCKQLEWTHLSGTNFHRKLVPVTRKRKSHRTFWFLPLSLWYKRPIWCLHTLQIKMLKRRRRGSVKIDRCHYIGHTVLS